MKCGRLADSSQFENDNAGPDSVFFSVGMAGVSGLSGNVFAFA
jgi:hypothetical protein